MKFQVNWPFCSEEKVQNRFSTRLQGQPSWIPDQNDFSYFWSTSHLDTSYQVSSVGLSVQENKFKINFKDGDFGGHIAFPIRTILAIFVSQTLPTNLQVNWPFGSAEEAQNRFPRWWPSWISNQNHFKNFWSTNHPNAFYQVWSQLTFWFRRRSEK